MEAEKYIQGLIERSAKAQEVAAQYDQEKINEITGAIAWAALNDEFRTKAANMMVDESGIGSADDKFNKIHVKTKGLYYQMRDEKSVGIVEEDEERGLVKYIKPMGVIAALVPITQGEGIPIFKTLMALKGGNSVIFSPHPRGKETCLFITDYLRKVLKEYDAPEDLIITIDPDKVSMEASNELMKQADFILATGGTPMVRVAYGSGTPAIGVGTGNTPTYIDKTADLKETADKIKRSKIFDNSTSCSSENNVIIDSAVYDDMIKEFEAQGAFLIKEGSEEKENLQRAIWPNYPETNALHPDVPGSSVEALAEMAGFEVPEGINFFIVEETRGVGADYPFTGEKLSPVSTLIKVDSFDEALDKMDGILHYQGLGHSCGIHTTVEEQIDKMAARMKVGRMLVNQPQSLGNSGAWFNGMPVTMTLGCGTWGHNSISNNVRWKDLVNYTTVSRVIDPVEPSDEEVFPESIRNKHISL